MNSKRCFNNRIELVHRANDSAIIKQHSNRYSAYEIDVQLFDNEIYVYHDDMMKASGLDLKNVTRLSEFIETDNVPFNFLLNVEIKVYDTNTDVDQLCSEITSICARRPDLDFIFSSFNESVYNALKARGILNVMMLADTVDAYRVSCIGKSWVCVDANILDELVPIRSIQQRTYVYNVKLDEATELLQRYSYVAGYIFDF